jgi:catechol 2,3-dioxygenase-like lactoylglutathione lyase family enzyme
MLTNKTVVPILPVVDLARARAFYEERLGLRPQPDGITDSGVVYEAGHGTKLEIDQRAERSKAEHTALSFEVEDLEREVLDLERRGVVFEDYDLPGLVTDHHIAKINGTLAAWFKDPDGNILCVHQQGARAA